MDPNRMSLEDMKAADQLTRSAALDRIDQMHDEFVEGLKEGEEENEE